ncbi:hypothetical protein EGH21_21525 [Halomicroarcula sp. F13]|uniref:Uncharacterized protein n=1 Tax=Haloarcula rubra TaxID=2487747 RepID=A0AAW4PWR3_9EURY|nr:hypothetical protein [Halomicroarcula rubra]MBX0325607.1 hypothetical protein [Halomicroarcula rubra]
MAGGTANLVEPRWTYWLAVAIEQERRIQELEGEMAGFKEALELAGAAQSE